MSIHALVTIQGAYKTALTRLQEETWQIGLRYIVAPGGAPSAVGTLPSETDVYPVAESINVDETDYTVTGNWRFEMGINDLSVVDWLETQLSPAVIAWIGNNSGLITPFPANIFVQRIAVYPIGSDGKAIPAAPYAVGTPVVLTYKTQTAADGAGSGSVMPPQIATVASLRTSQIGRSGRGRIFMPPLDSQSLSNGLILSTYRAQLLAAVTDLLQDSQVNGTGTGAWALPIVAGTIAAGSERVFGPYALINEVRIGDVYDTQRRRRRSITEQYVNGTISNPS